MRSLVLTLCCSILTLFFTCARAADNTLVPEAASRSTVSTGTQNASTQHFMAVTANAHATDAAVAMLKRGGSAVDAMIAAQLVLGLVEPQASGIGGGAFMLYWNQGAQQLHYFDARETAPAGVDENYFLQETGEPLMFLDAVIGGHAVGTPGIVKLLATTHHRFGKLPWADLFQPAIALAERGFVISPRLHTLLEETPRLLESPSLRAYFFQTDNTPKPVGTLLKNLAYAKTLKLIVHDGEAAFYRGALARDIVDAVQHDPNRSGALALGDLASYDTKERAPLCMDYREYKLCGAAPPSSGATTVFAILGMLQRFPPATRPANTAEFAHLFAEASRLAFADRDTYVADPDFVAVPTAGLIASDYLAQRAKLIDPQHAATTVTPGQPTAAKAAAYNYITATSPELACTSQLSIVDSDGNTLSMTTSVESAFGSRILVDGFFLNNQLTDFSFTPRGVDGKRVANRIEPGKRPRSSMAPIIVFRDGKPVVLIGSPGGARIIDYVAQTLLYSLDNELPPREAIASPHIVAMNRGLELEQDSSGEALKPALEALGHSVKIAPQSSGLNAIWVEEKKRIEGRSLIGSSDPRREGAVGGK